MAKLSEKARAKVEAPNFGYLATVMPDGSPQVSPVWVDLEGDLVLINTATGRVKEQNMRREPRVAISIADKDNQYEKVDIRGRVAEFVEGDEAYAHIDKMAQKYIGQEKYPWLQPGEERVVVKIRPESVSEMG
jgi:PPOX class probable F420-dependent enzyme